MASDENVSVITEAASHSTRMFTQPHMCQEDRREAYKSLISEISDSLHESDVKNIIWRHNEEIPDKLKRDCCALVVLQHLHEKGKFSELRVENLRRLMDAIKRKDMEQKVVEYQQQYPERHSSMPANTSNPRTSVDKQRSNTYSSGGSNILLPQSTVSMQAQQESCLDDSSTLQSHQNEVTSLFDANSRQSYVMGHHSQSSMFFPPPPQAVGLEPMSAPAEREQQRFDMPYDLRSASGVNTPGSLSASNSTYDVHPPLLHSRRSHLSSGHASFENFSVPGYSSTSNSRSNVSLSSGDSHLRYRQPALNGQHPPWYKSHSSLPPNVEYSPDVQRGYDYYDQHTRPIIIMPGRAMTAEPSIHSRRHARRHTVNPVPMTNISHDRLQYFADQGIDPGWANYDHQWYPPPHYVQQPGLSPDDGMYRLQNPPHSNIMIGGSSHSQPSYGQNMINNEHPPIYMVEPGYQMVQIQPDEIEKAAWNTGEHLQSHRPPQPSFSQQAPPKHSQSKPTNNDYHTQSGAESLSNHHTASTEKVQSEQHYGYISEYSEEDDDEPTGVYAEEKHRGEELCDTLLASHVKLRRKDGKKKSSSPSQRYSFQPSGLYQRQDKRRSLYKNRRSFSGTSADEQYLNSKLSEDTLVGSAFSPQPQTPQINTKDNKQEAESKSSDRLNNGATSTTTKKQKRPFSLSTFTRSKVFKSHEELVWTVKRDKLNKMIYKHKVGKYIPCSDKIELESNGTGPYPKLVLRLHPYGVEEDVNENVSLEMRIERPKRTGSGSTIHSSAEVEVSVRCEDVERKRMGRGGTVKDNMRSSFFFLKGFVSHQELKKSLSEHIVIRAKAKILFPF